MTVSKVIKTATATPPMIAPVSQLFWESSVAAIKRKHTKNVYDLQVVEDGSAVGGPATLVAETVRE